MAIRSPRSVKSANVCIFGFTVVVCSRWNFLQEATMLLERRFNIFHVVCAVILSITATTVIGVFYLQHAGQHLYINRDESVVSMRLRNRFVPERQHITFFDSEVHPLASQNLQKRLAVFADSDEVGKEADAAFQLAISMRLAGKNDKAARLFKHALQLNPYRADFLAEYGGFLADADDPVRADTFIMKALILSPKNEKALQWRRRTQPLAEAIDQQLLERIEDKKRALLTLASQAGEDESDHAGLRRAQKQFYFEHIYHTCAIEGNTISLEETRHIIETHLAVYGKSIQEHSEIIGLDAALSYINSTLVRERRPLTLDDIFDIHLRVLGYADPVNAGRLRKTQVFVSGYVPPPPENLTHLMGEYLSWLNSEDAHAMHPIKLAAVAHYWFAWLHPFSDGNGRTARLLMNLILMRSGYPPVIIKLQERSFYFEKLEEADDGDLRWFYRFIANVVERTIDQYLRAVVVDRAVLMRLGVNATDDSLDVREERVITAETIESGDSYSAGSFVENGLVTSSSSREPMEDVVFEEPQCLGVHQDVSDRISSVCVVDQNAVLSLPNVDDET